MDISAYLAKKGIELTEQQQAAISSEGGALLLLAVPGAGKTTALVARVAHLVANAGVHPKQILTLTFNRDAARELSARWQTLFGELGLEEPHFSTIHSFCYRVLQRYAAGRGTTLPQLLEQREGGSRRVLAGIYKEQLGIFPTDDKLDELLSAIGYAQNMLLDKHGLETLGREIDGFTGIFQAYGDYKRREHLMDFDDMLLYTLRLLKRSPQLCAGIREGYPYLNVDEVQDTSLLQHEILRHIAGQNLFFVGDEDQSIYGFRGAYPKAMLEFEQQYPGARLLKMERNFRSTRRIVASAQNFIAQSRERFEKEMFTQQGEGQEIQYTALRHLEDQWSYVADALQRLPQGQTAGVLFRQSLSGVPMAEELHRRGIAFYSRERRNSLRAEPIVRDILSCLTLSRNPGDAQAFLQVYYKLGCYITKEAAQAACGVSAQDIFKELIELADENKSTGRISYARAVLANLAKRPPLKMLETAAYDLGLLDYMEQRDKGGYTSELYLQKFGVLRAIAAHCATVEEFEDRLLALDGILADSSTNTGCPITLSTIHSAKGLEFDRVYILDALEGVLPTVTAIENASAGLESLMEEEARLFYVAATRAKSSLEILSAQKSMNADLTPSRFINRMQSLPQQRREIPQGVVKGRRLIHFAFGYGEIVKVSPGQSCFTVQFARVGSKVFDFSTILETDAIRLV